MKRALAVLVLLCGASALAYVLPTYSILRRLAEAREDLGLGNLKVTGSLSFHGKAADEAAKALGATAERSELQTEGTFWARPPGRCRLEALSAEGRTLAAIVTGSKERSEGGELAALSHAVEVACTLLTVSSEGREGGGRASLERFLANLGTDLKRTGLGRFGGQVAYVIGGNDPSDPQLWVYKDSFTPARLRFTDAQKVAWDVRLLDFGSSFTGDLFPRVLEIWSGDDLLLRFAASQGDPKATFPDKLF